MRIELMDPKWKQQKQREQEKKRPDSNLSLDDGREISQRIHRFAEIRQDIFGTGQEDDKIVAETMLNRIEEQKRQAAVKERAAWDGHSSTINETTRMAFGLTTVDDLRKQVELEKAKQIGPAMPPPEFFLRTRNLNNK